MLTLGIDTALNHCSVAIVRDDITLAQASISLSRGHAEALPPQIASVMRVAAVEARDFDRIGVVIGPGSFAGVRVGLAFARSFVLGRQATAIGVTSLEVLAAPVFSEARRFVGVLIDARRGEVYAALYGPNRVVAMQPILATASEAVALMEKEAGNESVVLLGDGVSERTPLPAGFSNRAKPVQIDPVVVARLAAVKPLPATAPAPLYLRPPDASPAARSALEGSFDLRE